MVDAIPAVPDCYVYTLFLAIFQLFRIIYYRYRLYCYIAIFQSFWLHVLDRVVLHLYVQKNGTIGKKQYYTGLNEISAVYNYSSAEADKLEEDGTKRLKELQNYKKCEMTIDNADLEIGDIVAGYDAVTNTQVIKPVIQKILKIQDGKITIDYSVKGEDE